jgi:hypothetical protein
MNKFIYISKYISYLISLDIPVVIIITFENKMFLSNKKKLNIK